jgi:hypothetical protein
MACPPPTAIANPTAATNPSYGQPALQNQRPLHLNVKSIGHCYSPGTAPCALGEPAPRLAVNIAGMAPGSPDAFSPRTRNQAGAAQSVGTLRTEVASCWDGTELKVLTPAQTPDRSPRDVLY